MKKIILFLIKIKILCELEFKGTDFFDAVTLKIDFFSIQKFVVWRDIEISSKLDCFPLATTRVDPFYI